MSFNIGDRVKTMSDGRPRAIGTITQVYADYALEVRIEEKHGLHYGDVGGTYLHFLVPGAEVSFADRP